MVSRPRLLDLFCGAGGAAMGYHRAGFEVIGVDIESQPNYPFEFFRTDAMNVLDVWPCDLPPRSSFDAVHASPPCQGYSRLRHLPWLRDRVYPKLIDAVRTGLASESWMLPFVIENVEDAPMPRQADLFGAYGIVLCGQMFNLALYRHRRFESNFPLGALPHKRHDHVIYAGRNLGSRYSANAGGVIGVHGHQAGPGIEQAKAAMGIDWMRRDELTQAIPPAYTEFIGSQLLAHLESVRTA